MKMFSDAPVLAATDPYDCGCTECQTGEYVPLRNATPEQVLSCARGELGDNNHYWNVTYDNDGVTIYGGGPSFTFPAEDFETLPPNELRFEHFTITVELDIDNTQRFISHMF